MLEALRLRGNFIVETTIFNNIFMQYIIFITHVLCIIYCYKLIALYLYRLRFRLNKEAERQFTMRQCTEPFIIVFCK